MGLKMSGKRIGNAMGVRLLALVCAVSTLNGCAALRNYPERSNDVGVEIKALQPYFDPTTIKTGGDSMAWRNEVVNSQILAIDLQFTEFEQSLARGNVGANTVVDMTVIGLGAATGVVGGAATKSILGVISCGITGAKGIVDKDVFYSKTMPVLLAQMEAQRKVQLVKIRTGLGVDASRYSLSEAIIDVDGHACRRVSFGMNRGSSCRPSSTKRLHLRRPAPRGPTSEHARRITMPPVCPNGSQQVIETFGDPRPFVIE